VGLNFKTIPSLLWPLVATKLTVATGAVKSSTPVAIVIGPTWQRLNVAMGVLTVSARCYCDICVKINMAHLPFTSLHKKILSTESSPPDPPSTHSSVPGGPRMCMHRRAPRTRHATSERRTGWSRKLLNIFDQVILLWVYKVVGMKYSRRGGTKVYVRLK
jgi:hypothetical protein